MISIRPCVSIFTIFLILAVAMTAPAGAVSEAEKIAFTDAEKEWLAAHSKMVVGGETDWAPFDFVDQTGKYAGIADDYLKVIGEKLGIEVEMVIEWDENRPATDSRHDYFAMRRGGDWIRYVFNKNLVALRLSVVAG